MTIQFNCPKCGSLIAFADKHAGKGARCLTCGEHLVIPEKSEQKPRTIEPQDEPEFPVPGFYRAVFIDSCKIFFDKDNLTGLVFIAAAVCFKFFVSGSCLAYFVYLAAWGYLFGFYLTLIYETATGSDKFPEIDVGTSITFLWHIIRPILVFTITVVVVELPFFIALSFFKDKSVTFENIWETKTALNLVLQALFIAGLFFFPTAILAAALPEDFTELFRFDRLIMPVFRAFVPYMVVVGLIAAACLIEVNTKQYSPMAKEPFLTIAGKLAVNLAEQVVAIIAIRSIGLFYRHFGCYFRF
jgi:hypothetical protein